MRKRFMSISQFNLIFSIVIGSILVLVPGSSAALSGSQFKAGRIMDDAKFFTGSAMTPTEIQNFLNAKVPSCDTNGTKPYGGTTRKAYAASRGVSTPFICLKSYRQNTPSKAGESGLCSAISSKSDRSSAQIIDDVARACGVSQKALIVLLQKEQSLITDDWPWPIQYRSATGYGCPDTAPCDAEYYGFFNQVYNAARQFKRYAADPTYFNHRPRANNYVRYNPNAACGGSTVYIENQATAGLYNYTPYQPNGPALNNLYGEGNSCSAYGNRNFWRMYNDWFGSTLSSYSGVVTEVKVYSDSARTDELSQPLTLRSNRTIYVTVKMKNDGGRTWNQASTKIGTVNPHNRSSIFKTGSWPSASRPANLSESGIQPGGTGTFQFSMITPSTDGFYNERFQGLVEGQAWFGNNAKVTLPITVQNPYNGQLVSKESFSNSTMTTSSRPSTSQNGRIYWKIRVKNTGTNTWSNTTTRVGTISPNNRDSAFQHSSWLNSSRPASLKETSVPSGSIGTFEFITEAPDTNGVFTENYGLVVEGVAWMNSAVWGDNYFVSSTPDRLLRNQRLIVNTQLSNNGFRLIMQGDGNLVVYNPQGKPQWNSGTKGGNRFIMQGDGNLVMYNSSNRAIWSSGTKGGNRFIMQGDGNLVMYNSSNRAIWSSGTR